MKMFDRENKLLVIQPIRNEIKMIKGVDYIQLDQDDLISLYQYDAEAIDLKIGNLVSLLSLVD